MSNQSQASAILGSIDQNLQAIHANQRNAADASASQMAAFYKEARRSVRSFDEARGLRYRPAAISLAAPIVGAGTASTGSNEFRISSNEDFLVLAIRGFVLMGALATEPAPPANLGATMTPKDRLIAKASNCLVTLLNKDSKVDIFENSGLSLATICPEAGGEEMRFQPDIVPGFVIPHNVTLQAKFALQSADAFFNTATSTYGITLSGLYLSREVR